MVAVWKAILDSPAGIGGENYDTPWEWLDARLDEAPDVKNLRLYVTAENLEVAGFSAPISQKESARHLADDFRGGYNRALERRTEASAIEDRVRSLLEHEWPKGGDTGGALTAGTVRERVNRDLSRLLGEWFVATHPTPDSLAPLKGPDDVGVFIRREQEDQKDADDLVRSLAAGVVLFGGPANVSRIVDLVDIARAVYDPSLSKSALYARVPVSTLGRQLGWPGGSLMSAPDIAGKILTVTGMGPAENQFGTAHPGELGSALGVAARRLRWTGHLRWPLAGEPQSFPLPVDWPPFFVPAGVIVPTPVHGDREAA